MARAKQNSSLSFTSKKNPEVLAKLNAVAPKEHLMVTALAERLLIISLDKLIVEHNIPQSEYQPANSG